MSWCGRTQHQPGKQAVTARPQRRMCWCADQFTAVLGRDPQLTYPSALTSLWARSGQLEAVRYSTPLPGHITGRAYGTRSTPTLREAGEMMRGGP